MLEESLLKFVFVFIAKCLHDNEVTSLVTYHSLNYLLTLMVTYDVS